MAGTGRLESDVQDFSPTLFYQRSACLGELDEAVLSTCCHTFFFDLLLLLDVVGSGSGLGSGSPQSACPSLS